MAAQPIRIPDDQLAGTYRSHGWWPDEPLARRFERHVATSPDSVSVRDDSGARLTRQELWDAAGALAEEMISRGIRKGDVVAVCLPNVVGWQVVFLASLRLGAVPATIPTSTDAHTLGYICTLVAARALAVPDRHHGKAIAEDLREIDEVGRLELLTLSGNERTWTQLAGEHPTPPPPIPGLDHLMFTSSTTGMPKAVAHTANTLAAVNIGFAERFDVTADTPIFMASPLGHSVGAWHGGRLSLFTGAPLILQSGWDPERAIELIEEHQCGFTVAPTPFLQDLMGLDETETRRGLARLRSFLCGGAPVPSGLVEQAATKAPNTFVTVLWGMTEGGVTTCVPGTPLEKTATTAGVGLPGLELRTLDPHGNPTTNGEAGELAIRGPGVFVGYLGQDELYRELLTDDGFFRTGDLAELTNDGHLVLTGRLKDVIIRGGVNISPLPLEQALSEHPAVERVAVVGVPDSRLGERICAAIVPRGPLPELPELQDWLSEAGLPRRQWPETVYSVDELPQTALGKIRKNELREHIVGRFE